MFPREVVMEALRDLWMLAAMPGIGMPDGVFSAQTWSLCQAFSIPYSKIHSIITVHFNHPYPIREYGLVLLSGRVGRSPTEKSLLFPGWGGEYRRLRED